MERAELRLRLLAIAHHHQQSTEVTLEIVRRYEAAFEDILKPDGGLSAEGVLKVIEAAPPLKSPPRVKP